MTDFFVSYNKADGSWAEWIAWHLEEANYTTVLQEWDFRPGCNFVLEMQKASAGSDRTIAVLSPSYLGARYTQPEWAAAFARDPQGWERRLIPVRVKHCILGGLLAQIAYVDLVGLEEPDAKQKLLLGVRLERAKPPTPPAYPADSAPPLAKPLFPGRTERHEPIHNTATASGALADAIREQWSEEAATRAIEYPAAIRVRWRETDRPVVASAEAIRGQQLKGEPHTFRIHGDVLSVAEAFVQLQRRQLCVLGRPGGGKTVLVLLLTLRLLERRLAGSPVPVLLTVSSWDPRTEELTDWLARRIGEEYEFLRRSDEYGANAPQRLVREGSVLPILDGLDEIAQALRPVAIAAIDRAMAKGFPAVVTCRGDEFEAAVAEGSSFLSTTPVVEIQDVRPHEAKEFLVESTPNGYARWEPVLRELEANPNVPAAKALSTPLMLWLAREVYRAAGSRPTELLDRARFPTVARVEEHLLDAFVPTAYAHDRAPMHSRRHVFEEAAAERWLRALAANLYRNRRRAFRLVAASTPNVANQRRRLVWDVPPATDFDFAWWNIYRGVPNVGASVVALSFGVPLGVGPAIAILAATGTISARRLIALGCGALGGVLVATSYRPRTPGRIHFGRISFNDLRARARESLQLGGLAATVIILSLVIAQGFTDRLSTAFWSPIIVGLAGGFGIALTGLLNRPIDVVRAQDPESVLAGDRSVATTTAVLSGLTAFATVAPGSGLWPGCAAAVASGIAAAIGMSSWGWFFLARLYFSSVFASSGRLPWRIMSFLADAHRRGVLRQSGSVYQFRHRRLQERLAGRASTDQP